MKLKSSLRKHYRIINGSDWKAKRPFKSTDEILEAGFPSHKWKPYTCDVCGNLHIADRKKREY